MTKSDPMDGKHRELAYRLVETNFKPPDDVVSRHVELKEQGRKIEIGASREVNRVLPYRT